MPSKTLKRRRATPSMHRLGWTWSRFVFRFSFFVRRVPRIGLIHTSKTCGILFLLSSSDIVKETGAAYTSALKEGSGGIPGSRACNVHRLGFVKLQVPTNRKRHRVSCGLRRILRWRLDNVAEMMADKRSVECIMLIDIIFDIGIGAFSHRRDILLWRDILL